MTTRLARTAGTVAGCAAVILAGMMISSPGVDGQNRANDEGEKGKIHRGFEIAPVKLNLVDKDLKLVGLGSYIVNAQAGCDGCHSAGPPTQYLPGGNPYFGQPEAINPDTYLGGGRNFGPFVPGSAEIVSRNLTPDNTGRPAGGLEFADFLKIIRTGADLDQLHPNCPPGTINTGCIPRPFDGSLLQIMPWTEYRYMTDRDLRAVYEYLSAVPCIEGPPAPSPLHNDCN